MIHIHKWSKWKQVPAIYSGLFYPRGGIEVMAQERRCEKCGKTQIESL